LARTKQNSLTSSSSSIFLILDYEDDDEEEDDLARTKPHESMVLSRNHVHFVDNKKMAFARLCGTGSA